MNVHKQVRQLKDMLYLQSHHCILVGLLMRDLLSFLFPHKRLKYLFVRRMISVIYILSKIYSMHKLVILYIINLLVHIHTYV